MNKQCILKFNEYFDDLELQEKLLYIIYNKMKKFRYSRRKKSFIKSKYPHRKSDSSRKSLVAFKYYLTKNKNWYTAKKKCLTFNNFEKLYLIHDDDINQPDLITLCCNYNED